MADGAWADGVKDMLPSVTYPNHTTLVTGVRRDHGCEAANRDG
jgi:predicted AlkP superfamily pyrophosphatase or phosphodiesterase